jgi:hypothetical protein
MSHDVELLTAALHLSNTISPMVINSLRYLICPSSPLPPHILSQAVRESNFDFMYKTS